MIVLFGQSRNQKNVQEKFHKLVQQHILYFVAEEIRPFKKLRKTINEFSNEYSNSAEHQHILPEYGRNKE